MLKVAALLVVFVSSHAFASPGAPSAKPKYPPEIKPLSRHNQFIRTQKAPDYWNLSPYLTAQITNSACSIASSAIVLNALRDPAQLRKNQPLLTQENILSKVRIPNWTESTAENGGGISIALLEKYFLRTLEALDIQAELKNFDFYQDERGVSDFRRLLKKNEASNKDFIILNFDQGHVLDDEAVGHFAVIGAYDEVEDMILILDTDKEWMEPYWVPVKKMLAAMYPPRSLIYVNRL